MPNRTFTPDFERAAVSAQAQVGSTNTINGTITVPVPPNTETLTIMMPTQVQGSPVVVGQTSGVHYVVTPAGPSGTAITTKTYYVDVSSSIDTNVIVTWVNTAMSLTMYVYADAGVHVITDPAKLINGQGAQYVIPTVPNTSGADHPPNELQCYSSWAVASGTNILGTPLGQRYRIFYAQIAPESVGAIAGLADSITGNNFVLSGIGAAGLPGTTDFSPSGFPLSAGAAVVVGTTSGNATINLVYTQENP